MSDDQNKGLKVGAYAGVTAASMARNQIFKKMGVPGAQSGMWNLAFGSFKHAPRPIKAVALMGTAGYGALSYATGGGRVLFNESLNAMAKGASDETAQRNATTTCPFIGTGVNLQPNHQQREAMFSGGPAYRAFVTPFKAKGFERRINHGVGAAAIAYKKPGGSAGGAAKEFFRGAISPSTGVYGHVEHMVGAAGIGVMRKKFG